MNDNVGSLDAFHISKSNLLNWIKTNFNPNFSKIEDAYTGALYCQIINSIYPKKVKMNKVNFKAKLEHETISNYKILQQAFSSCNITKNIEVEKLNKGKYQDNFEFLQWLKRYHDLNGGGEASTNVENNAMASNTKEAVEKIERNVESASRRRENSRSHKAIPLKKKDTITAQHAVQVNAEAGGVGSEEEKDCHILTPSTKTHNTATSKDARKKRNTTNSPTRKQANLSSNILPKINQHKPLQPVVKESGGGAISSNQNVKTSEIQQTNISHGQGHQNSSNSKANVNYVKFSNNNDLDQISRKFLKCSEELQRTKFENQQLQNHVEKLSKTNEDLTDEVSKLAIQLKRIEMIIKNEDKSNVKSIVNQIKVLFGDNDLIRSIDMRTTTPTAKSIRPVTGKLNSINRNKSNRNFEENNLEVGGQTVNSKANDLNLAKELQGLYQPQLSAADDENLNDSLDKSQSMKNSKSIKKQTGSFEKNRITGYHPQTYDQEDDDDEISNTNYQKKPTIQDSNAYKGYNLKELREDPSSYVSHNAAEKIQLQHAESNDNEEGNEDENEQNDHNGKNKHTGQYPNNHYQTEQSDNEEGDPEANLDNYKMNQYKYLQKSIEPDTDEENEPHLQEVQLDRNLNNSDDEMFKKQEKFLEVHKLDN